MKIAIIGLGGHSKVVQDIILSYEDFEIVGYFDDKHRVEYFNDYTITGPILSAKKMIHFFNDIKFVIAIGNNKIRKRIFQQLGIPLHYYVTLRHKSAIVSPSATIGFGTVIMAHSVINAYAQIGDHVIINTSSIIEHDNEVGHFVHVSPNVTSTGGVQIEEGTHIGAAATIIPNKKIGKWSTIGAGATVVTNIPSYSMAVGIPARVKKTIEIGGE